MADNKSHPYYKREEIELQLEYVEIIKDMMIKRGKPVDDLEQEKDMLQNQLKKLET